MDEQENRSATILTLPVNKMAPAQVERGTIIRVFSPAGLYWRGVFRHPRALYFGSPELVFTACHFDETKHSGDYYSEFDDPVVEEILLQAALSLAIGFDGGVVSLYPHHWTAKQPHFLDLEDRAILEDIGKLVLASEVITSHHLPTDPPPPPSHGGPAYDFRNATMPVELQARILRMVDASDHVLVRGLSAWLKARMLLQHRAFALEALYSLFVAMDASFSLVCRILKERGIRNPDAWDAGAFLNEAEGHAYDDDQYFGDFYVGRVRTLHPESRYGASPYAPVSHCDAYTLYENLREVYRLLILGEALDPKNYPAL